MYIKLYVNNALQETPHPQRRAQHADDRRRSAAGQSMQQIQTIIDMTALIISTYYSKNKNVWVLHIGASVLTPQRASQCTRLCGTRGRLPASLVGFPPHPKGAASRGQKWQAAEIANLIASGIWPEPVSGLVRHPTLTLNTTRVVLWTYTDRLAGSS